MSQNLGELTGARGVNYPIMGTVRIVASVVSPGDSVTNFKMPWYAMFIVLFCDVVPHVNS